MHGSYFGPHGSCFETLSLSLFLSLSLSLCARTMARTCRRRWSNYGTYWTDIAPACPPAHVRTNESTCFPAGPSSQRAPRRANVRARASRSSGIPGTKAEHRCEYPWSTKQLDCCDGGSARACLCSHARRIPGTAVCARAGVVAQAPRVRRSVPSCWAVKWRCGAITTAIGGGCSRAHVRIQRLASVCRGLLLGSR